MQQTMKTGAAALAALLLLWSAPGPAQAVHVVTASSPPSSVSPVVAVISLLAWLLCGWLLVLATVVVLARIPGASGRQLGRLGSWLAPRSVRRSVEVCLGLSVLAGGVLVPAAAASAVGPAGPAAGVPVSASHSLGAPPVPDPSMTTAKALAPSHPPNRDSGWPQLPNLDWAGDVGPVPATAVATSPTKQSPGASATGLDLHRSLPQARYAPSAPAAVVVRPGDTLWALAASQLRARGEQHPRADRIAQAWPQWWHANRDAIGADPDLLHPGTLLSPPAD